MLVKFINAILAVVLLTVGSPLGGHGLRTAGAAAYPPDLASAQRIVPAVRVGPWSLTMGIAGLKRALGGPSTSATRPMFDQRPGMIAFVWKLPSGTLTAWSADGRAIGYLELRDNKTYRTAKGIGVGSNSMDVQAAYGPPATRTAIPGASRYIYDALGLAVFTQGTSTGFMVVGVDVFRPGTAKTYWKF